MFQGDLLNLPVHNPHPADDTQNDVARGDSSALERVVQDAQNPELPNEQPHRGEINAETKPKASLPRRVMTSFIERWRDPYRNRPNVAEWLTVLLTVVIAAVGFLQWFVYRQQTRIMGSNNPQTQKLIEASDVNASAARKSAQAARDFADTAALITAASRML